MYRKDIVLKKYSPEHYHEPLWFKDITDFAAGTAVGANKCPENTARVGDRPRLPSYYTNTQLKRNMKLNE
jgi:hypothetical protein